MAFIPVDMGFEFKNSSPVDIKQNFKTLEEMRDYDIRFLSETAMCTNDETGKIYIFNIKNSDDPDLGRWRAVESSTVTDLIEKDNTTAVSSKGVHGALYITVPEVPAHYEQANMGDLGALEIVADGSVTSSSTQIAISDVTPLKDGETWSPSIGEYAVLVALVPESEKEKYAKESDIQFEDSLLDLDKFDDRP